MVVGDTDVLWTIDVDISGDEVEDFVGVGAVVVKVLLGWVVGVVDITVVQKFIHNSVMN